MNEWSAFAAKANPSSDVFYTRDQQVRQMYPIARIFTVTDIKPILASETNCKAAKEHPLTITMITPDFMNNQEDQLFIDRQPVFRDNWSFDRDRFDLRFRQGEGESLLSGHFRLVRDQSLGYGILHAGGVDYSAAIKVKPVTYRLSMAKGAAYAAGSETAPQLKWDADSDAWKNAQWSEDCLTFTYSLCEEIIVKEHFYYIQCEFSDPKTEESWREDHNNYSVRISSDMELQFKLNTGIDPHDTDNPFHKLETRLFPYQLRAKMDPIAQTFTGAALCEKNSLTGVVYGVKGAFDHCGVNGYYRLQGSGMDTVIAVHDGKLYIDDQLIASSRQFGSVISWREADNRLTCAAGLPQAGELVFSGSSAQLVQGVCGGSKLEGRRVTPEEALTLCGSMQTLPGLQKLLSAGAAENAGNADTLNAADLLNLDQFARDKNGWYDRFQQDSMSDFYEIVKYYMPKNLRQKFVSVNPPELDPTIKGIAGMPGSKGEDAAAWYKSLSVDYISNLLGNFSDDENAAYINKNRACKRLKQKTGQSGVYSAQSAALYTNRYVQGLPVINDFLEDQKTNYEKYNANIDEDADNWKEEIAASIEGSDEQIQELKAQVDRLAAAAKDKKYWAYVMIRYTMTPSFLSMLQMISFNPDGVDGSEFARRVQRITAVLNILDPSAEFVREFTYIIQIFQVANVLPQLIDFSGDISQYSYAGKLILDKFIQTYIDSGDPEMQEAAKELAKLQQQGQLEKLMELMQEASVGMSGIYNWARFVSKCENIVKTVLGITGKLAKIAMLGTVMTAVTFMMIGFVTGQLDWSNLTSTQQVFVVGCGAGLLAQFALVILKRGIAFKEIFTPGGGIWNGIKMFFSSKTLADAQARVTTGIRGWIIGTSKMEQAGMEAAAAIAEAVSGEEVSLSSKVLKGLFGRNLDEFLATRVGAIMAVAALVCSAIDLAKAETPYEKAMDSCFVVSSALEVIALGGAWAIGGLGLEASTIGACLVSTVFPILSGLAVLAAIAGIVLLIVLLTKKPESPVKEFAEKEAKDAGLYMPYKAEIDSFEIFQPSSGPQLSGAALCTGDSCLRMESGGAVSISNLDNTGNTCFYLTVDADGNTKFTAPLNDENGSAAAVCLTYADGKLSAKAPFSKNEDLPKQQWHARLIQAPKVDDDGHILSGVFYICADAGMTQYLGVSGNKAVVSNTAYEWKIEMTATKPCGLTVRDWTIQTFNRDLSHSPALALPGSEKRTWSIDPALPSFLELNTDNGVIAQKQGVGPDVMKNKYTLKVANAVGEDSTSFFIEVQQPKEDRELCFINA